MKPKSFPENLPLLFAVIAIVSLLIVIGLMILGPFVGNTFSEINSSLSPSTTQEASPTGIPTSPTVDVPSTGALLETRRLTLEFPPKIKADTASDIVRLTLEVDDLGNITPTAYYQENVITGEVIQIPNLYETHNVGIEASFDIAGVEVKPSGSTYQPMQKGKQVIFYWSIRSSQVGKYRGTIWVHLIFVDRISGEESRMPISVQIVDIEAVDFFGFSVNFVRTSGIIGSVLGIIVGFPFFDDIVKYWWSRRKKRKTKAKPK